MGFWFTVAVYAALYAIHKYTAPKTPKGRADDLSQRGVPTVRDGITVPIWYGMCQFDAPNLVWNSPRGKTRWLQDTELNSAGQRTATKIDLPAYYANMYFILGIPGGRSPTNPLTWDRKITWDDLSINGIRYVRPFSPNSPFYSDTVDGFDQDMNPFTEHDGAFFLRVNDRSEGVQGKI